MSFIKKLLLVICIFTSTSALAAGSDDDEIWDEVVNAIVMVESGGNVKACKGKYAGPMMISPGLVRFCNNVLKSQNSNKRYTLNDRYSLQKSKEMFIIMQEQLNPENDIEYAIRSWNGGPGFSVRSTNSYYKKVMSKMNK